MPCPRRRRPRPAVTGAAFNESEQLRRQLDFPDIARSPMLQARASEIYEGRTDARADAAPGGLSVSINLPLGKVDRNVLQKMWASAGRLLGLNANESSAPPLQPQTQMTDQVAAFVKACCFREGSSRERASVLLAAYRKWSMASGAPGISAKRFSRALASLGYQRMRSSIVFWCGLSIRSDAPARLNGRSRLKNSR
jgi:hypothetical protein